MLELIGLVAAAFTLAFLVLPLWTFIRVSRISRNFDALAARVRALESMLEKRAHSVIDAPSPSPAAIYTLTEDPSSRSEAAAPVADSDAAPPLTEQPVAEQLDLERRIGGRWLLYTGVTILLLGVSFFLKYAFDNEWVGPRGRVGLGALAGLALTRGGLALDSRGLEAFGRALAGTGLAILYLSVYAALAFYGVIGRGWAFAAMAAITATAAALADRRQAESLAFVAVAGGFLTPFLVGGARDAQITLFAYDALLVAGTWILARRHRWVGLYALSYVLTCATLAAWANAYYTDEKWLRTLLFLSLFVGLFLAMLQETRRTRDLAARVTAALLWTAPGLYHLFALIITSDHPPAFHVYLIVFTLAGLLMAVDPPRPAVRVLVLLAALGPMFGYMALPRGPSTLVANVVTICAVCGLHLMALGELVSRRVRPLASLDLAALHLASLALFGLLQQALAPARPQLGGSVAVSVGALGGALWLFFRTRDPLAALHAAALAFTLIAVAITLQFDGRVAVVGWAAEGSAVTWLGLRAPSRAFRAGGLVLWAAAALRLTDGYFETPLNFTAAINERSLATVVVILLGYLLVWRFAREGPSMPETPKVRAALHVACSLLTLLWISAEILSFWDVRAETPQADLLEQLMLSLAWGAYGAGVVVIGLWRGYRPLRYIGIAAIACTVLKVFFVDLWDLGGIYRVVGFLTLGILLVLVSYLYQRGRTDPARDAR